MKILAFAASNSSRSINRQLVNYACELLKIQILSTAEIELIDINDFEMPLYSSDREENSGIPDLAHRFYERIGEVDALLISFAEHNGSYTAAFKNLYDWTSRIDMKVYQGKLMVLLSTSPGPGGAGNVLRTAKSAAPHFGANLLADLSIPKFNDNFDVEAGKLVNEDLNEKLIEALSTLKEQYSSQ